VFNRVWDENDGCCDVQIHEADQKQQIIKESKEEEEVKVQVQVGSTMYLVQTEGADGAFDRVFECVPQKEKIGNWSYDKERRRDRIEFDEDPEDILGRAISIPREQREGQQNIIAQSESDISIVQIADTLYQVDLRQRRYFV
jgi:hypothetical protein